MANYGERGRGTETVPDWLLGNRKWRLLDCLTRDPSYPWEVPQLADEAECAMPTAYEYVRALRAVGAIAQEGATYALDEENDLAAALIDLAAALARRRDVPVERPPRPRQ